MAALQYVDVPGYAAILFRRTYADLALPGALMDRSKAWLLGTDARWTDRDKTWSFPSGASVTFGYLEHEDQKHRYQSAEFQLIGFDELTQFGESQYEYLFSRLRRPEEGPLSEVPLRQCAASNPGGRGHVWVKNRLVEGHEPNSVFIPAKLDDNPHVDKPAYKAALRRLSPTLYAQLLEGDWGAFEGMAYPTFRKGVHIVPPFPIPEAWQRFEALDYGINNPTSWGIFAVDYDGNVVLFDLYYSPGLVSDHASAIHAKRESGWWARGEDGALQSAPCYAPPDIKTRWGKRDVTGKEMSAESEFAEHGILFSTAQNDRRAGYLRVAEMVKEEPERLFPDWHPQAGKHGAPRFYVVSTDAAYPLVEQMQAAILETADAPLARFPGEAVDLEWESAHGHAHAMARYGLMSRPSASKEPEKVPDDPRARVLWEAERKRERASGSDRYQF